MDEDEQWKLSFKNTPINECFVCQKHRYGLIYIDKRDHNNDMVEILDPEVILEVKENLKLDK